MRTNTEDLPAIDPLRTYLDILRDALELMKEHQPVAEVTMRGCTTGDLDCGECGFPLTGNVKSELKHSTYRSYHSKQKCKWIRSVAELEAWVRVEEQIKLEADLLDETLERVY